MATGKSTLVPIEIYKQLSKTIKDRTPRVVVCVPTRMSALSLAKRVQELAGKDVVVDSRHYGKPARKDASIVYTTPSSLVSEYVSALGRSGKLSSFTWDFVVVDEVHTGNMENSLVFSFHDFLQTTYQNKRMRYPKLGLLSATPVKISIFEDTLRTVYLSVDYGSKYAIRRSDTFLEESLSRGTLIPQMAEAIATVHNPRHDLYTILAFVPGISDLDRLFEKVKDLKRVKVVRAYGSMKRQEMNEVFRPAPNGVRKIVIATNVAESSITVPAVGYVVDSLLEKRPSRGIIGSKSNLVISYISENSSLQRRGRAGRDVPVQEYFPMVTREEYFKLIKERPHRTPDIELVSLEKTALTLIKNSLNPRKFLREAGQAAISATIFNLLESKIISLDGLQGSGTEPVAGADLKAFERFSRGLLPEGPDETKTALAFAGAGFFRERFSILESGEFWGSLPLGLLATLFLKKWFELDYPALSGCLVASLMDAELATLFPYPRTESGRNAKSRYYEETLPEFMADDTLTTVLYVFYGLFLEVEDTLSLDFNMKKIVGWCKEKGLNSKPVLEVLRSWKNLCSIMFQRSTQNFSVHMEIPDIIEAVISCLKNDTFFLASKAPSGIYYRKGSTVACFLNTEEIPYNSLQRPSEILFLSITESRRERVAELVTLFLPRFFVQKQHRRSQFILKGKVSLEVSVTLDDLNLPSLEVRLPVVKPEDIGLERGSYVIPKSLGLEEMKRTEIRKYTSAMYPPVLASQSKQVRQRQEEVPLELEGFQLEDFDEGFGEEDMADIFLDVAGLIGEGLDIEQDEGDYGEYNPLLADVVAF
jgi:superfamily II DNA/RNA helicase